jgi:general secretion pathway protein H
MAILAGVIAIGVPRILRSDNNIKKVVREMAVMGKMTRNQARLKNTTYRWAIRLDDGNQAYWIENSTAPTLISAEELAKIDEAKKSDEAPKSPFSISKELTKEEKKLPNGLSFILVENSQFKESLTRGTAYIYFTPQGLVENSLIQIGNKDNLTWTLVFNPLTGQADVVKEAKSLKDLNR